MAACNKKFNTLQQQHLACIGSHTSSRLIGFPMLSSSASYFTTCSYFLYIPQYLAACLSGSVMLWQDRQGLAPSLQPASCCRASVSGQSLITPRLQPPLTLRKQASLASTLHLLHQATPPDTPLCTTRLQCQPSLLPPSKLVSCQQQEHKCLHRVRKVPSGR